MTEHQFTTPSPENKRPPITGEQLMETKYGQKAIDLIGDVRKFNFNQNIGHIKDYFIDAMLADADNGEILSTARDENTGEALRDPETGQALKRPISSTELFETIEVAIEEADRDGVASADWVNRIPRASGIREAIVALMESDQGSTKTDDALRLAIHKKRLEIDRAQSQPEAAPAPTVTPALGERAIYAAPAIIEIPEHIKNPAQAIEAAPAVVKTEPVVEEQSEPVAAVEAEAEVEAGAEAEAEETDPMVKLTEGLSEDDRLALRGYAEALFAKNEFQEEAAYSKDPDIIAQAGRNAVAQQQLAGQYYREMSPPALMIAKRYARLHASANRR